MAIKDGGGGGGGGGGGRHICRNICIGIVVAIILLIVIMVILAFTVFKAKDPVIDIDTIKLDNLAVSFDIVRVRVNLNISLDVGLSVYNPNKVGFKYKPTSAFVNYRGQEIAEVPIPAGKISADDTAAMNVTVTLMADRLISNSDLYSDVSSGALPLNTYTKIKGKVNILNIFRVSVVSSTTCDFTVDISNRTVVDQNCKYKTKL